MEIIGNNFKQKSSNNYCCEMCHYITDRKNNMKNHMMTAKHKMEINGNEIKQKTSKTIKCDFCNKIYKTTAGLWKHNQKCKIENPKYTEDENKDNNLIEPTDKELIMMLLKQNSELITQNAVLVKNGTNNTINNSHNNTNSYNKTFNLQFFLNETCKDAMNITDFVDSIKLQLTDLEKVGEIGFVEGISNIINSNLKALDITQRPIHCTDKKREVLYIKDENKWEKENNNKTKIRKAIKQIAHKNSKLVPQFKEVHPDCGKSVSKFSDQYNKIIIEAMGGSGDNDNEKEDKIIKNISNLVTIDKED
jgi:hypothetical protein